MKPRELLIEPRLATIPDTKISDGSAVKTILLQVQNDDSLDARVETGLALARACSAHLSCVHVTPFDAYVGFDSFGGVFVMNDLMRALDGEDAQLRSRVEQELRDEDVSWDYEQVTGRTAWSLAAHAALADLVVVGRNWDPSQFSGPAIAMLGDLLHWTRTPTLIPADEGRPLDPTGTALIAWDGSFQAANAVRASIGLLKIASDVRVVQVDEQKNTDEFPSTRLLQFLSRHGIHAILHVEPKRGRMDHQMITGMLLSHARAVDAAYMVLGAYNHSRFGEYVFGGVTRSLLGASPVPIVLAR